MSFNYNKYRTQPKFNKPNRKWPNNQIEKAPIWCAVDLRDGNQALVNPMTVEQKQKLFDLLVKIGVKQIEIGFPSASQPDFDFCRQLITKNLIPDDVVIQVLTQARPELIERTFEALKGAKQAIVHVYNSTSTVQREQVFKQSKEGIKQIAEKGAKDVKAWAEKSPETDWTFQYSPESFTGTEMGYAVEVINAVIDIWQPQNGQKTIINLPATVEMTMPNVFADQVEWVLENINHRDEVIVSLHTHNDRGCAVAAAELGTLAGADRIEGTLMGNGERTGNMDLITMAMNLYSQGIDPRLSLGNMKEIVDTVEYCTEIITHPRHPYAGELVFTAFSGSHQDAIRKCLNQRDDSKPWEVAYLPIDPQDVGRKYEEVVRINSQSGKGGIVHILERDYDITLPRWLQIDFARHVQRYTEKNGGEINTFSIHKLFKQSYMDISEDWKVNSFDIHKEQEQVSVTVSFGEGPRTIEGTSTGLLSAITSALEIEFGSEIQIEHFDEHSLEEGTKAEAMAFVKINIEGKEYTAASQAYDITTATIQALLSAFSQATEERITKKAV